MIEWPDLRLPPINLLSLGREDSPCRKKCKLENGKCTGCLRTADEIENWTLLEPRERWEVIARIYKEAPTLLLIE